MQDFIINLYVNDTHIYIYISASLFSLDRGLHIHWPPGRLFKYLTDNSDVTRPKQFIITHYPFPLLKRNR